MTLRIGVVGAEYGTLIHVPGFQSEGLDVVGLASADRERATAEAARLGIERVFFDYRELIEMPNLDAVSVTGLQGPHYEIAMAALRAGKHVFCEKPLAINSLQAKEMVDLATKSGLTAVVAHEFRFTSGWARMKELIDEGFLGQPKFAVVRLLRGPTEPLPLTAPAYLEDNDLAAAGGGFLFRMGSHYVDALRFWFGEVVEADGHLLTMSPERTRDGTVVLADADDTFFFTLRFESGMTAEMVGGRAAPFAADFSVSMFGTEGTIVAPQTGISPPSHGKIFGARLGEHAELERLEIPPRLESFQDDRDDRLFAFRLLVREFLRGIEEGSSPSPNFLDGYRCIQVLDAVRESAASGHRVRVAP
jgi:predicted dehydrogenase